MTARLPDNEAERLAALREHRILDTAPEEEFDDLVRLAAHICDVPISAVSLIDADRQWFKSIHGLDAHETPREVAFCAHTILGLDLLIVPDTQADSRFADNPFVTGEPRVRFYAGMPLLTEEGHALGSLCVIDHAPKTLTPEQGETLRLLARQVASHLKAARRVAERERLISEKDHLAAERERTEAERLRLAAIVESSEEAIYSMTLEGTITSWNHGAEYLYGYTADEIMGQPADQFVPPECRAELKRMLRSVRRRENYAPLKTVCLTKMGMRLDLALRVSPILDGDAQVIGASMIAHDITEQKRMEEALGAEREFTRALLESLQEGIVACDAQGTLTLFNRATRELHGLPEQPLPPEKWAEHFDLYHADGLTPMEARDIPLYRALQGEAVRNAEMVIAPRFGPAHTLLASGQAIYSANGEKLGAVVAMHDVTERRQAEQELSRLAAIVESSEEAILAATLDGTIVSWNKGAENLYGFAAAEMIGRPASLLVPSDQISPIPSVVTRLIRDEKVEPIEVLRIRKDGTQFHAALSFSPIRDMSGAMIGLSCTVRDITARKQADEALAEAHAALTESEVRLRRLTEAAFEGIAVSQDGILVDVSPAFSNLFGYDTPNQMLGLSGTGLAAPDSQTIVAQRIAGGNEDPYEATLQRRDGTTFQAELRGRMVYLDGRPARVTAVHDITERKAMEEEMRASHRALEESQARLAQAQRIARVGSWEYDLVNGSISWSGEMFRLLGRDPKAGVPDYEAAMAHYHPEDAPVLKSLVARAAEKGIGYELDLRGDPSFFEGGPTRWYHTTGEIVTDAAGNVVRLMGTLADISERKQVEEDQRERAERLHQSEAVLRAVLESAPVILYAADADGTVTLSEGTGLTALGMRPGEVVGRSVFEFSGGDEGIEDCTRRALSGEAFSYDAHVYGLCLHTELRPVWNAAGAVTGIIGVCFDVTERVRSEERFRVLFEQSSDAHLLFDEEGIIACNPAAVALLRCSDITQLLSLHPAALSPEFQADGRRSDEKCREMDALAHENGFHRFEWTHRKMDGEEFPVEVTLTPVTLGERPVLLVVWHDLSERKRTEQQVREYAVVLEFQKSQLEMANAALEEANAQLEDLATTDGLTGLKNHRTFQERLAEEVSRASRYGLPLSLVLLDVDHFKQYNDTYGHPAGDAVLKAVAGILQGCARDTDIVARYGGEEFVLILPQTDWHGASAFAERLRAAVESHPWSVQAVTASFGVTVQCLGEESEADLVARADRALYQSKAAGRNRVTYISAPATPAEALLTEPAS